MEENGEAAVGRALNSGGEEILEKNLGNSQKVGERCEGCGGTEQSNEILK